MYKRITFWIGVGLFLVFTFIIQSPACINAESINSWLLRAKDAGNPQQVAEFLGEYKDSLGSHNLIENKYSSVFHYPGTYMPRYVRAIDGLVQRAKDLSTQSPSDTSYQMGLVNLEKDLGDIDAVAYDIWIADIGWLIWTISLAGLLVALVAGVAWMTDY